MKLTLLLLTVFDLIKATTLTSPIDPLTTGTASPTLSPVEYTASVNILLNGIRKNFPNDDVRDIFESVTKEYLIEMLVIDGQVSGIQDVKRVSILQESLIKDDDTGKSLSSSPTSTPSTTPTSSVTISAATLPTVDLIGTLTPSTFLTTTPSTNPSVTPSSTPSTTPSSTPSATPSSTPSETPSATPSTTPSDSPSQTPSSTPSATVSEFPTNFPTKFTREQITSKPTPFLPIDFMMDHSFGERFLPGNENSALAVRISVIAEVNPSEIENNSQLAKAINLVLYSDLGNNTLYHYKLFESHGFFKDIKPFDASNDAYDFGNSVMEGQASSGKSGSPAGGLGEALGIVAGVAIAVCAAVVSFIKYKRYKKAINDKDEDSIGDNDSMASEMDVESTSFEPFVFDQGKSTAATQQARLKEHSGAIEVNLHR